MIDRKTLRLSAVVLVGAVAMVQLSECRRAGQPYDRCDFDTYWRYHLAQERCRVHESRYLNGHIPQAA
jgi:hypothetical protein